MKNKLKLTIELVPKSCWFSHLRDHLSKEQWVYNDIQKIQRLEGTIALCPDFHSVKHIGFAQIIGKFETAKKHFKKINKLTEEETLIEINNAFKIFNERSKKNWILDISIIEKNSTFSLINRAKYDIITKILEVIMDNNTTKKSKILQEQIIHKLVNLMNASCIDSKISNFNSNYISVKSILLNEDKFSKFTFNVFIEKYNNSIHAYSSDTTSIKKFFLGSLSKEVISDVCNIEKELKNLSNKWLLSENLKIDPNSEINVVRSNLARHKIIDNNNVFTHSDSIVGEICFNKNIYSRLKNNIKIMAFPKLNFKNGLINANHYLRIELPKENLFFAEKEGFINESDFISSREIAFNKFNIFCRKSLINELKIFYPQYTNEKLLNLSEEDLIQMSKYIEICKY